MFWIQLYAFIILNSIIKILCISSISINNQCVINYDYQDAQRKITFKSCEKNNQKELKWILIQKWKQCEKLCCVNDQQKRQGIQKCLRHLNSDQNSFGIIEISSIVFLALIGIIIFLIILYGIKKLYNFIKFNKKLKKYSLFFSQIKEEMITKSINFIIWVNEKQSQPIEANISSYQFGGKKNKNSQCMLCMHNKIQIQTTCGHQFHTQCFYNWCQRHYYCPKCPQFLMDYIKLYCVKCYAYYFILDVEYYKKLGAISLSCLNCISEQEFKNKVVRYFWIDSQLTVTDQNIQSKKSRK